MSTPSTSSPPAGAPSPMEAAIAALAGAPVTQQQPKPSNPGEQAAPGGKDSAPTARQWSEVETQVAQTYLRRFGVPDEFLVTQRDRALELGLHLQETQKGFEAKTKARDTRIEQLEAQLVQLATAARQAAPGSATPVESQSDADLKALAEELGGDASKIGPALERWIATRLAKIAPQPNQSDAAIQMAQELAVESARTQLVGQFPALQPGTPLFGEVRDAMQNRCQGPYYDALPLGQREVVRMRDAATYVLGAPSGNGAVPDNSARSPGSSVPRPAGRSEATPAQQNPLEAAQAALARAGLR